MFIGILFILLILQEIQIISLRRHLDELNDMFVLFLANKIKNISAIVLEDEDETSGDE